jgi:hypothetical protein
MQTLCGMNSKLYTCPCCGYRALSEPPGSYEICHVCFWEDDQIQLLDPWYSGGANHPSLVEAQENFASFGACDHHGKQFVKGVLPDDEKDSEWRPASESDRVHAKRPRDLTEQDFSVADALYYWRQNAV